MNHKNESRARTHNPAIRYAVAVALASSQAALGANQPTLPVPCFAGSCAPNKTQGFSYQSAAGATVGPSGFVTSGQASATQSGNKLTVTQTSNQAILNWQSFNIGAGNTVQFNQPSSTAVALNKIYQASPSSIFGALNANGQVYLINPNGFVFGNGATVNTAGLIASSLGLFGGDATLASGITSNAASATANAKPALTSDGRVYVTDATGNLVLDSNGNPQPVQIQVQSGATLSAADGGRVMLAGQVVSNAGQLNAPDGQVVLAAGQTVYLQSSSDPSLRGLVVAVNTVAQDSNGNPIATPAAPTSGTLSVLPVGTATNSGTGANGISAARGNVSLLGLAVNQNGRISASTSVSANGSVILEAGQGNPVGSALGVTQGGTVTIGAASDIEIPLDDSSATAAVAQAQAPSSVAMTGQAVYMDGGIINAPGGSLAVLAAADPFQGVRSEANGAAQIRVAADTSINLAGSSATLPMSANLVTVQLFGSELEDDPDQRTGALHGQTVIVDTRDGKPSIISDASWQSVLEGIQDTVAQRSSAGGSASFQSEGDVVVNKGATINVSGGTWTYAPGVTQTSQLIGANGQVYSIETANAAMSYSGVLNPTYTQSYPGFGVQETGTTPGLSQTQSGYVQGFSAGTVTLAAPSIVMQGTLVGSAVDGPYQRSPASIPAESLAAVVANGGVVPASGAVAMALGGTLRIGDPAAPNAGPQGQPDFFAPAIDFVASASPVAVADGTPLPAQTLQLPVNYITNGGFTQTQIFSDGTVTVPAGLPLNLGNGGSLLVLAPRINVDSSIQALGGSINLEAVETADALASLSRPGISIGDNVTLNVSGQWTNNSQQAPASAQTATYEGGGSIILSLQPNASWLPVGTFPIPAGATSSNIGQFQFDTSRDALTLGNNVSLVADGGAWLQANNAISGGAGGAITIAASADQAALQIGSNVQVSAFGVQGAAGGSFTLMAPRLLVQNGSTWATAQTVDELQSPGGEFDVGSALYSQDGFSKVNLTATAAVTPFAASNDILTIATGTQIDAVAQSLQLSGSDLTRPTGGTVLGFAQPQLLNAAYQTPSELSFTGSRSLSANSVNQTSGDVDIQSGATITVGPGGAGSIALAGQGNILIDGTLQAQGGTISAQINAPATSGFTALILDPGYVAGQRIEVGSQAVLNVGGAAILTPNTLGLPIGTLLPAGSIDLTAGRAEVITDAGSTIDIAGGSALLAQQNTGPTGGYAVSLAGSAGGNLGVQSGEAVSLLGTLFAAGGLGANSGGVIEGGALSVSMQPVSATLVTNPLYAGPFTIDLMPSLAAGTQPEADTSGTGLLSIAALESSGIDSVTLRAAGSNQAPTGGTININPQTGSATSVGGSVALSLGQQITLDAANIGVGAGTHASLTAPSVTLTDSQQITGAIAAKTTATGGDGSLTVDAQEIALSGYTWIQGVQSVTLTSGNDVQLDPISALQYSGGLNVPGTLNITAARIFPATLASFTLTAGSDLALASPVAATANAPTLPLSVGGTVSVVAPNIIDNGTLLAPFGDISLSATGTLTLGDGSYTSVSGSGAVLPFGATTYGQQEWVYTANNNTTASTTFSVSGIGALNSLLSGSAQGTSSRTISLSAPNVQLQNGSTVNVSGGGDLSAYEWIPGLGGSADALSQANAKANNLYAIMPGIGPYASYDMQEFPGSNTSVGQSVYLSGAAGLPAGYYALLPARYALLPGAYLIQAEPSFESLTPGTIGALQNGTPVITGYLTYGNGGTGLQAATPGSGVRASSGYSGFAVWPGSYAQQLAQYDVTKASGFFPPFAASTGQTSVVVPADAGTLAVAVGSTLQLGQQSVVNTAAGAGAGGGTVGTVDLYTTGPSGIFVGTGQAPTASVVIDPVALQNWGAGDLIIGGDLQANGNVEVTASSVEFGSGSSLSAQQILAVANNSIFVDGGASIAATSPSGAAAPVVQPDPLWLTTSGGAINNNAALLAVSNTELPIVLRTATGTGAATISVGAGSQGAPSSQGATLTSRGGIALDAPGNVTVSDSSSINAAGASWSLASDSIGFVAAGATTPVSAGGDTLQIDPALLAQIGSAGSLRLASAGALDILTSTNLGGPSLNQLTLAGTTINDKAASATFTAQTISLEGAGPTQPAAQVITPDAALPTQSLTFSAGEIDFGGAGNPALSSTGSLVVNNYGQSANTSFIARGSIVGQGITQLTVTGGDVVLQAAQLTATPLASAPLTTAAVAAEPGSATQTQSIAQAALTALQAAATAGSQAGFTVAGGNLQILPNGAAASPASLAGSLGGGLSLTAGAIDDSGSLVVPGGRASLQAVTGDIALNSGATIDTGGITVTVADQSRGAAGGIVNLSAAGNLLLASGSTINVAGAGGSPDGFVNLTAVAGNASVGSTLNGGHPGDAAGGSFSLYAGQQLSGGLGALTGALTGFTSAINVEVGSGDLDLAAGSSLSANEVTLAADSGAIDIAGTINAPSGALRGSIGLFAQNDVTLESTGTLRANASTADNDSSGRGGNIELSTVAGTINLLTSASSANGIQTQGPSGAGSVLLRAPTVGGDDVAISQIGANLTGVGQLIIEPVLQASDYAADYQAGYVPTGDITSDDNINAIATTVQTYYGNASSVIPARLQTGSAASVPITIEPGVVVNETAATATLSAPVNLYDAIGAGSGNGVAIPIDLTVRATGSLSIKGSITDGTDDDGNLLDTPSSSLRFVAGANLASANPLGVMPGLTSVTLSLGAANARSGQGTLLETGTGDIDLVSAGQITINPFSSAFTTGMLPTTTVGNQTLFVPGVGTLSYMNGGGNVAIDAGTNIVATNALGDISDWYGYSTGKLADSTVVGVWGANLTTFAANPWSVASFGGGDVQVSAGGNISSMSVAAAGAMDADSAGQIPYASGGLNVDAGGNITVAQFFLSDAAANVNAGGAFTATPVVPAPGALPISAGALIALQDSQLSLWAEDGITISAIVNPTMLPQPKALGAASLIQFSSYGPQSALNAQTSSGTLALNASDNSYPAFTGILGGSQGTASTAAFAIFPTSLDLSSLTQDVNLGTPQSGTLTIGTLYPSATGQYNLFAGRDILGGRIYMSDALAGTISTSTSVTAAGLAALSQSGANATSYGSAANFSGDLHAGDATDASIVAGRDIGNATAGDGMQLSLPEPAQIMAGRDIVNLSYQGQNLSANDMTLISAGRNFTYPLTFLSSGQANGVAILDNVGGPGNVDVLAGGTINLGFSLGLTTNGNFRNANLPAGGASITMVAGLGQQPDYAAFLTNIVEPSTAYQTQLVSFVESVTGQTGLTASQADAELAGAGANPAFNLSTAQEQEFIDGVFFNELNQSGIEATNVAGAGYQRGYTAISTLFPGTPTTVGAASKNAFDGDLNLIYSQINTQSGGDINLLVPGGEINVGVANGPAAQAPKPASELGIVASDTGNVSIYSLGDVNVNSSRIFALGGGNILIWSQLGSIDAGNGAKSSLSIPPPVISYDSQGNPYVNFGAAVAGSGIRTIQTGVGEAAGDVNLIAPVGTVNAGDAGIGAAGNINIAAAAVVGAANINFGGAATGVPATVSSVTASVSGAASTAASATNSATSTENSSSSNQSAAPIAGAALSWLDVFVSGLGMDNCKPEDVDCLKRQQKTD